MDLGERLGRRGGLLLSCRRLEENPGELVVSDLCSVFDIAYAIVEPVTRAMRVLPMTTSDSRGLNAHKDLISSLKLATVIDQGCFMHFNGSCLHSREVVIADTLGVSGREKNITQRGD